MENLPTDRIRTAGDDLGGAHLQLAEAPTLSRVPSPLHQDAGRAGGYRGTAPTATGRSAGLSAVDTVHQGDLDGIKGVYHINAVDEVTQWQVVGAAAYISEAWLIPVLEAMLRQFPFKILGFHSDNGSEFINHTVADLLNKLL